MNSWKILNRAKKAGEISSAIMATKSIYDLCANEYKDRFHHRAIIKQDEPVYPYVLAWLEQSCDTKNVQLLTIKDKIEKVANPHHKQKVTVNGYKIDFYVDEESLDAVGNVTVLNKDILKSSRLIFVANSHAAINALHSKIQELDKIRKFTDIRPSLYFYGHWGWSDTGYVPPRPIESIFLPGTMKEDIVLDLDTFLTSEDKFNQIGLPWHRGYLFHGPPGNGKSSLAKALATHFNLDVYHLPISALPDDRELYKAINGVSERSVLILEDIDIFKGVDRDSDADGPTLAGLLNCLDGVATPNGLITIMTTNNVDVLDEALIRKGRVDRSLEIGPPTPDQISGMYEYVYNQPLGMQCRFNCMADFTEVIKQNMADPEGCRMELQMYTEWSKDGRTTRI